MTRPRTRDLLFVLSLLALTGVAARAHFGLPTDVENLAMKSVGTATEAATRIRRREFGDDPSLVLLVEPRAPRVLSHLDGEEIDAWQAELARHPGVVTLHAAPAPGAGARIVTLTVRADEDGRYAGAVRSVGAAARRTLPPTFRLAAAGQPVAELALARALVRERDRILPLLFAVLALVLAAVYRHPILVLGALLAPLAGVFWVGGLQAFLGLSLDPVSSLLGPTVLTVGVAAGVHVLERYRRALDAGAAVDEASRAAVRGLRRPFLLTVATTVAGFLGLWASPIPAVRRFGLLASVGVALGYGLTLSLLPSWLRLLHRPRPRPRALRAPRSRRGARRRWVALAHGTRAGAPAILAVTLLASLGLAHLWRGLAVDTDPLRILPETNELRRQAAHIAEVVGGSDVFELLLGPRDGPGGGPLALAGLFAGIVAVDGVAGPAGPPRTSPAGYVLAPFLLEPEGSSARERTFDRVERRARAGGWSTADATGIAVRVARDSGALVRGQARGMVATLACLFAVMAFGFRSLRLALLGLVPNVVPCLGVYGGLAWAGRSLSVASAMIGTVMLGLIVDDTIHLLHAWRETEATGGQGRRGERDLARTLALVGRPVVVTTLVLCAGFATTIFGHLTTTREFGALSVVALVTALAADLILLPALLSLRPVDVSARARALPWLQRTISTS